MKAVAYMLDTNTWSVYAGDKADYAIGGPTIELFFKSYDGNIFLYSIFISFCKIRSNFDLDNYNINMIVLIDCLFIC